MKMSNYLTPACAIFLPHTGKFVMSRLTNKELINWFKTLDKPAFAPPDWFYGPAVFTTFSCMGYGSYLIWKDCGGFQGDGVLPLTCYGTTLALTWVSPALMFKSKSLGVAIIGLTSILGATIATAVTFKAVNSKAGYLVLPYLGWRLYVNILAFGFWRKNRT